MNISSFKNRIHPYMYIDFEQHANHKVFDNFTQITVIIVILNDIKQCLRLAFKTNKVKLISK